VDLSGLPAGQHTVPVKASVNLSAVRVIKSSQKSFKLTLEPLLSRDIPLELTVSGEVRLVITKVILRLIPHRLLSLDQHLRSQSRSRTSVPGISGATTPSRNPSSPGIG